MHLRRLDPADEREFLERTRASQALHRPWSHPPTTPGRVPGARGTSAGETNERIVVCRNDDGAIVGYFGLGQIFYGHFRNAYLGYYALEPFQGQGYMREGLELVLRTRSATSGSIASRRASSRRTSDRSRSCAGRGSARRAWRSAT